jgi:hypothetical protein
MRPLSPKEERMCEAAFRLLHGVPVWDAKKNAGSLQLLSANTRPTDVEARLGLYSILLSMAGDYPEGDPRNLLLAHLAFLFLPLDAPVDNKTRAIMQDLRSGDPFGAAPLQVTLSRRSQRDTQDFRDKWIAEEVAKLRADGLSYDSAIATMAENLGKSPRQIKRIVAKFGDIRKKN